MKLNCDKDNQTCCEKCDYCFTSTELSIHSRRCFMTGEYCSKQSRIQREREKLYEKNKINAFVVMNFSDMSDIFYKWRLLTFIESLKKYFYIEEETKNAPQNKLRNFKMACISFQFTGIWLRV